MNKSSIKHIEYRIPLVLEYCFVTKLLCNLICRYDYLSFSGNALLLYDITVHSCCDFWKRNVIFSAAFKDRYLKRRFRFQLSKIICFNFIHILATHFRFLPLWNLPLKYVVILVLNKKYIKVLGLWKILTLLHTNTYYNKTRMVGFIKGKLEWSEKLPFLLTIVLGCFLNSLITQLSKIMLIFDISK